MIHALLFAAMLLPSTATAQDRGAPGKGRVDPAYEAYLVALDELAESLDITLGDDQAQLWDGKTGIYDPSSMNRVGVVLVGPAWGEDFANNQTKQEQWHFPSDPIPQAGFLLEHEGSYAPMTEGEALFAEDPSWDLHPCYTMNAEYVDVPDPSMTAGFDYTNGITRTHFDLLQQDPQTLIWGKVGDLLREWHQVPNTTEKFVDHWAFMFGFDPPDEDGDQLLVVPTGVPYATTTAFWNDIHTEQDDYIKYSQIQYRQLLGYQCAAQLTF
jgi:hypothetical protein